MKAEHPGKGLAPVESREELVYLLARASELEHSLACVYLYAGYSLKSALDEGGLTPSELRAVLNWKRKLARVAVEEMLHLAQVSNLLTAVGGAPHFSRPSFPIPAVTYPLGIVIDLQPFSTMLIERIVCYEMPEAGILPADRVPLYEEMQKRTSSVASDDAETVRVHNATEAFDVDYRTVGEFYHKIESAFRHMEADRLFIGPPEAQLYPRYLGLSPELVEVTDLASACRAIEMIIEQGESPSREHPDAHFVVFDLIRREYEELSAQARTDGRDFNPVRPMIANPSTRGYADGSDSNHITNPVARELCELFDGSYDLMLTMLIRFFSHGGESEDELRLLARGTLRLMASVLRPLGEALAKTSAGPEYPGRTAGPGFGLRGSMNLYSHKGSGWISMLERLNALATRMTALAQQPSVPLEVQEAAAAIESVAEHLTPIIPERYAEPTDFSACERSKRPSIRLETDGPLLVRNLSVLTNSKGERLSVLPIVALCRCGGSNIKPYCDGTHARNGFSSAKSRERTPDRLDSYEGNYIIVLDNRGTCCHFGNCTDHLPEVFHHDSDPFVTIGSARSEPIMNIVRQCPSGALGFAQNGETYKGETREPEIFVAANASYYVRGGIDLEGEHMQDGASLEHYTLCRCGHSKNKPFCDGSHWYVKFSDPSN